MSNIPDTPEAYRKWWEANTDVPYGYCWCGCSELTTIADKSFGPHGHVKGEPKRYLVGHQRRIRGRLYMSAQQYQQWWQANTCVPYGLCWCGCGNSTALADKSDASRPNVEGEPTRYLQGHHLRSQRRPTYVIDPNTECWLWQGSIAQTGYPMQYVRGYGQLYAHRLYFERRKGLLSERSHVHHTCGIRHCVNPAHLQEITPSAHSTLHGSPNKGNTLISKEQEQQIVRCLRENPKLTQKEVAEQFGVKHKLIGAIWNRHNKRPRGRTCRVSKADIPHIRQLREQGLRQSDIGGLYGVKGSHIGNILSGKYVPPY